MAFTLNNFTGAETGGPEELLVSYGTVSYPTTGRNSGRCYTATISSYIEIAAFGAGVADAGDKQILGFWFYSSDNGTHDVRAREGTTNSAWTLELNAGTGTTTIKDANAASIGSDIGTISTNTWYLIEIVWEHTATADIEVFIDGVSKISSTTGVEDLTGGGTFDRYRISPNSANARWDDIYIASGAASSADLLGAVEVYAYQNDVGSAVPDLSLSTYLTNGGTLNSGIWSGCGQTPYNAGSSCTYSNDAIPNKGGVVYSDTGTRTGPNGDSNITGTLEGYKYTYAAYRGTGGNTTHYFFAGSSTDSEATIWANRWDTAQGDFVIETSVGYFNFVSETIGPATNEYTAQGFGRAGAKDITMDEMWAQVLHLPSTAHQITTTPAATYTVTGPDVSSVANRNLPITAASFTITGPDINLVEGFNLEITSAAYSITGPDIVSAADRSLSITAATYNITGPDIVLTTAKEMNIAPATYIISGSLVLSYSEESLGNAIIFGTNF